MESSLVQRIQEHRLSKTSRSHQKYLPPLPRIPNRTYPLCHKSNNRLSIPWTVLYSLHSKHLKARKLRHLWFNVTLLLLMESKILAIIWTLMKASSQRVPTTTVWAKGIRSMRIQVKLESLVGQQIKSQKILNVYTVTSAMGLKLLLLCTWDRSTRKEPSSKSKRGEA